MAKRTASHKSITPTATADTTNLVDSTYPLALQGASSTQVTHISEVMLTGQATSSTPTIMTLGRDSQIATGSLTADTNLTDASNHPATAAIAAPVVAFNRAATNKPQRSATLGGLCLLSINCFGGAIRWAALQREAEIVMVGNTASFGELSLSAFTGGTPGALAAHVVYETL